jgi:catechol 2,3-dioxygenase-like lactoylglutathione lyase family enzyme
MAIAGMIHVNSNCSDYDRSKAFYEVLSFKEVL